MTATEAPTARVFLVRITDQSGKVTGYAVTEQVSSVSADTTDPQAKQLLHSMEEMFRDPKTAALKAIPFPAEKDPGGRGYMLFASGHPPQN